MSVFSILNNYTFKFFLLLQFHSYAGLRTAFSVPISSADCIPFTVGSNENCILRHDNQFRIFPIIVHTQMATFILIRHPRTFEKLSHNGANLNPYSGRH
jgi:hypothetical protein